MSQNPFTILPALTAVSIAYKNANLIADRVSQRVPVLKKSFRYTKWTMEEPFTVPDTKVGRKSKPNEVEFTGKPVDDSTSDFGLDDPVPQDDVDAAAGTNIDPLAIATMGVTNLVMLDREQRVANLVFDANQYATANKTTLSGTAQFNDFTNSDPIGVIMTGLDACIMRPNKMVLGRAVYTKLVQHPKIVKAFFGTSADSGVATREFLAKLFELDEVMVGEGWINTAKRGQAPTMVRVWGKHMALLHNDPNPQIQGQLAFTWTAEFGTRLAGSMPDSNISVRGGQRVRAWESVKEVISANDLGYFIQNAVA